MSKGPVLFDLDTPTTVEADTPNPAQAEPVPDLGPDAPEGRAMQTVAVLAARKPSVLARWFWGLLLSVIGAMISIAAWNFVTGLIAQNVILGAIVTGLIAAFVLVCLLIVLRELGAIARLSRIDKIQHQANTAIEGQDLAAARAVVRDVRQEPVRDEARRLKLQAARRANRWSSLRCRHLAVNVAVEHPPLLGRS